MKDAVDRVVAPSSTTTPFSPPREWTVAPVLMASPTGESRPAVGAHAASASGGVGVVTERDPPLPLVTDRYGAGEMDDDAMRDILERNVFAPRQFAVYKRYLPRSVDHRISVCVFLASP